MSLCHLIQFFHDLLFNNYYFAEVNKISAQIKRTPGAPPFEGEGKGKGRGEGEGKRRGRGGKGSRDNVGAILINTLCIRKCRVWMGYCK